ncbi:MAG: 6-phosphofructokinase [Planctomycetaceae bacterium]|nr:6-phosphofructokinase [Planctomycetaceae bacterium]
MARTKRIGILTGGGDVPGLNAVIKSMVYRATEYDDYEVVGIRRGWEGLTHVKPVKQKDKRYLTPLDRENTRRVDRTGGTFLHTSRTNPVRFPVANLPNHQKHRAGRLKEVEAGIVDATPIVLSNIKQLKLDYLVAIGGDDTLSYASVLSKAGMPVVAVPKTMDNDVRNTEYCVGFSTAMTRAVETITRLRTTLGSHERVGIVRMFGRDAGFTALYTAYVTSARCCIPEARFDIDALRDVLVTDKKSNPSRYALLLMSEGATWHGHKVQETGDEDMFGHRRKSNVAEQFASYFAAKTKLETTVMDLTYQLRAGDPDFLDKMVATNFATMAFQCITSGTTGKMVAVRNGNYTVAPIPNPKHGPRTVNVRIMYDRKRFRPNYKSKKNLPIFMLRA